MWSPPLSDGALDMYVMGGQADVMVTGGTEAAITPLCYAGFAAIKALTTSFNDQPTKSVILIRP